jgi:hypothetical protein
MSAERATKEVAEFTIPSSLDIQDVLKRARGAPATGLLPDRGERMQVKTRYGRELASRVEGADTIAS